MEDFIPTINTNEVSTSDVERVVIPQRIQRKRVRDWKMPKNTIYVGRPTKWGNPFTTKLYSLNDAVKNYRECVLNNAMVFCYWSGEEYQEIFEHFKWISENIEILRGKNLACWCKCGECCHADILLEIANRNALTA